MVTPSQQRTLGLLPGSSIGEYSILGILESSPVGSLFQVRHRDTKAVSELFLIPGPVLPNNDDAPNPEWQQSVRNWSRALAALQTLEPPPQIARLLAFGEVEAGFYVLMQAADGITLRQLLERKGARSPEWVLAVCAQIASALDFAAAHGFAHGGLNPNSVVLERSTNDVVLRYFGLHPLLPASPTAYTAPEQIAGQEGGTRADIYALGALLYTCLQGEPPLIADSPESPTTANPSSSPALLPNQPEWLQAIVAHAMQRNPADRYNTAEELIADFRLQRFPTPPVMEAPALPPVIEEPAQPAPQMKTPEGTPEPVVEGGQGTARPSQKKGVFARFFAPKARQALPIFVSGVTRQNEPRELPAQQTVPVRTEPSETNPAIDEEAESSSGPTYFALLLNRVFILTFLFVLLPLFALCLHSLWLVNDYGRVYIMDRQWLSTGRVGDTTIRLAIGDMLNGQEQTLLTTEKGGSVTMRLSDSIIRLDSDSQLQIRKMGFMDARIRELELLRGQAEIDVQPQAGRSGQYAVLCHGILVDTSAGRFQLTAQTNGVQVRILSGEARVTSGASRRTLAAAQKLSAPKGQPLPKPDSQSAPDLQKLTSVFPAAEAQTSFTHIQEAYFHKQQETLMPLAARLQWFAQHTFQRH